MALGAELGGRERDGDKVESPPTRGRVLAWKGGCPHPFYGWQCARCRIQARRDLGWDLSASFQVLSSAHTLVFPPPCTTMYCG